ncbi:MAG: dihydrofolate reductase family protein [Desulfoprunum sp.]|jgi:dihydrofolate reductase|uniref:dihydrofolate reductase family protein n=1 Tax=Desulfoprunum sp. TaxID=2020866 RepID=UPI00052CF1F3|nr:deaminase/reductase [Desulfobulbus sp. Tol-SR]
MTGVRVENFTISIDGYGAGPDQGVDNPLGIGGEALHDWLISTRAWRRMHGKEGGASGIDDDFAARGLDNFGAWIIGRNMFGPVRGPWPDRTWRGWWGDEPPFHCPVFVLTHHPRPPIAMNNGTIFHFVTAGIHQALESARQAAPGKDVRIGGGADTIRQYLRESLIDELHIAIAPVLLGQGEALFRDLDLPAFGYQCADHAGSEAVTHVILKRMDDRKEE